MRRLAALIAVLLAPFTACAGSSGSAPPPDLTPAAVVPGHLHVSWHTVARGLSSPISVTNAGDRSGRLFVVEQGGTVRLVRSGKVLAGTYLDISDEVRAGGEQGFLSIAFHLHFRKHPLLYAAYTRGDGALVVSSFRATSANAKRVAASTERHILVVPHPGATNHNGGQIFFGDHGYLYVTTGDGGAENDQFGRADTRDNLTGKILRINVDKACGAKAYCIPKSNPYATSKRYRREIIAWGLRNPWRVSYDRPTGKLWIGDVGQNAYEEVDRVGVPSAHDFGWSCKEGNVTFNRAKCAGRHLTPPIQVIAHSPGGNCALVGGYVYRGKKYRSVAGGTYVYTDNCSGRVWALRRVDGQWRNAQIGSISGNPSGFGLSQSGELYVATLDGRLHRAKFTKR
ncbi:MAG TPA: PQQ-dependent sugar dehydrogenase [Mycobacteriales bacterium]|nr:PQQ-dependent sugar dehydrogenase [Mycobacteriales bacterium]